MLEEQKKQSISRGVMKVTLGLFFASGEKVESSVEMASVPYEPAEVPFSPYLVDGATAPEEPTLISSPNFVQVG